MVHNEYQDEHYEAEGNGRQEIAHLFEKANVNQFACVVSVYCQSNE